MTKLGHTTLLQCIEGMGRRVGVSPPSPFHMTGPGTKSIMFRAGVRPPGRGDGSQGLQAPGHRPCLHRLQGTVSFGIKYRFRFP